MESYCEDVGGQQFLLQMGQRSQLLGEKGNKVMDNNTGSLLER